MTPLLAKQFQTASWPDMVAFVLAVVLLIVVVPRVLGWLRHRDR